MEDDSEKSNTKSPRTNFPKNNKQDDKNKRKRTTETAEWNQEQTQEYSK